MARDVQRQISHCLDCRRRKSRHAVEGEEQLRLYQRPGEDVGIDPLGPFTETNVFGCRYALTCYDFYNHFFATVPIRHKRAITVARAIVTKYLMDRSCPRRFHRGRGEELMSEVLHEVNELLSVGYRFSSSYSPESGGQAERSRRFINDAIGTQIREQDHRDWDLWVNGAIFVHSASVLPGTHGLTPFFLEFGRELVMPEEVGVQLHPFLTLTKENYAKGLMQRLEQGRREWNDLNHEQRESQNRLHDTGVILRELVNGTYVLKKRAPKSQPKLVTKWLDCMLEPYEVVERVKDAENTHLYILEAPQSDARGWRHPIWTP